MLRKIFGFTPTQRVIAPAPYTSLLSDDTKANYTFQIEQTTETTHYERFQLFIKDKLKTKPFRYLVSIGGGAIPASSFHYIVDAGISCIPAASAWFTGLKITNYVITCVIGLVATYATSKRIKYSIMTEEELRGEITATKEALEESKREMKQATLYAMHQADLAKDHADSTRKIIKHFTESMAELGFQVKSIMARRETGESVEAIPEFDEIAEEFDMLEEASKSPSEQKKDDTQEVDAASPRETIDIELGTLSSSIDEPRQTDRPRI